MTKSRNSRSIAASAVATSVIPSVGRFGAKPTASPRPARGRERRQLRAGQKAAQVPGRDPRQDREQQDVARDPLEVETKHVRHQLREHGVGRHEQRPEHRDERRGDHEAARDGRGTAPPGRTAGLDTRGGPRRIHKRKRRGRPRVQCAQRQRAGVSKHARATHPGRGETMGREREGQRRAAKREQLQRRERRATRVRPRTRRRSPATRRARGPVREPRAGAARARRPRPTRSTATGSDPPGRERAAAHRPPRRGPRPPRATPRRRPAARDRGEPPPRAPGQ